MVEFGESPEPVMSLASMTQREQELSILSIFIRFRSDIRTIAGFSFIAGFIAGFSYIAGYSHSWVQLHYTHGLADRKSVV